MVRLNPASMLNYGSGSGHAWAYWATIKAQVEAGL